MWFSAGHFGARPFSLDFAFSRCLDQTYPDARLQQPAAEKQRSLLEVRISKVNIDSWLFDSI